MNKYKNPFIKLLKWRDHYYCFDVNRNQLLKIPYSTFQELQKVQKGIESNESTEVASLTNLGFLSEKRVKVIEHPQTADVDYLLNNKLSQITLQITQDCNFRCSYCIYSDINNNAQRSHTNKYMKIETAKEAVDYLYTHSSDVEKRSIGFYGGEPLLNFSLIEFIVEYAEKLFSKTHCLFTMTSNCSLLNDRIIEFMVAHDMHLVVSLDGSEKIQNKNRRYSANGKGSYKTVIRNINRIKENHTQWFNSNVGLSMVIDPRNDYDEISSIFDVFSENRTINAVVLSDAYSLQKVYYTEEFVYKQKYNQFLAFLEEIRNERVNGVSREARQLIDSMKKNMYRYIAIDGLPERQIPSGPCVPGATKMLVTVDGSLYPCERVSELSQCMRIGSLKNGVDAEKVKEMMNFAQQTADQCKNCWAFLHCNHCLSYVDNNGIISAKAGLQFCKSTCEQVENELLDFAMLHECRKMGLNGL